MVVVVVLLAAAAAVVSAVSEAARLVLRPTRAATVVGVVSVLSVQAHPEDSEDRHLRLRPVQVAASSAAEDRQPLDKLPSHQLLAVEVVVVPALLHLALDSPSLAATQDLLLGNRQRLAVLQRRQHQRSAPGPLHSLRNSLQLSARSLLRHLLGSVPIALQQAEHPPHRSLIT